MSRNAVFICIMTLLVVLALWVPGVPVVKTLVMAALVAVILHMTGVRDRAYRRRWDLPEDEG